MSATNQRKAADFMLQQIQDKKADLEKRYQDVSINDWMALSDPANRKKYEEKVANLRQAKEDYENLRHDHALTRADIRADYLSTPFDKVLAVGKGYTSELIAPFFGMPQDLSEGLTRMVLSDSWENYFYGDEPPILGSQWIRKTLSPSGLTYENIGDLPPSERPYAVAGGVAGMATPFAVAPLAYSKGLTPSRVLEMEQKLRSKGWAIPNMARGMTLDAKKNPLFFAVQEGALVGSSAIGAGYMESQFPGSAGARTIGELAPMAPTALAVRQVYGLAGNLVRSARSWLPGGVEAEAGSVIRKHLIEGGEDPLAIAQYLDYDGATPPALYLAKIGKPSPTLLNIRKTLIERVAGTQKQDAIQLRKVFAEIDQDLKDASKLGNPEIMRIVAEANARALREGIESERDKSLQTLQNTLDAYRLKASKGAKLEDLGKVMERASKNVENSWKALEERITNHETLLWNKVPKHIALGTDGIKVAMQKLAQEGDRLEGIVWKPNYKKQLDENKFISSGEHMNQRSKFLDRARDAKRDGKRDLANRYNTLADGILDDLKRMPKGEGQIPLKEAREWTKWRANTFDMSTVRRIVKSMEGGKEPPGTSLQSLYKSNQAVKEASKTRIEFQMLRDVFEKVQREGIPPPEGVPSDPHPITQFDTGMKSFLHAMTRESIDEAGEINMGMLKKFLDNNQLVLEKFNMQGLRDPYNMKVAYDDLVAAQKEEVKTFDQSVFGKLVGTLRETDPKPVSLLVEDAMFKNPKLMLKQFADAGRKAATAEQRKQFNRGMQTSVFHALVEKATRPTGHPFAGLVSGHEIKKILSRQHGDATLREWLVDTGTIFPHQMKRVDTLADELIRFEDAILAGKPLDTIAGPKNLLQDGVVSYIGVEAASKLPTEGHALMVAQRAASAMREFFSRRPAQRVKQSLVLAMQDPVVLRTLLESRKTPLPSRFANTKMRSYLVGAGYMSDAEAYREEAKSYNMQHNGVRLDQDLEKRLNTKSKVVRKDRAGRFRYEETYPTEMDVMEHYIYQSLLEENEQVGPYMLDYVQTYLELDNKQRAQAFKNITEMYPNLKKSSSLKRSKRNERLHQRRTVYGEAD